MRGNSVGATNVFEREGDYWTIAYQGKSIRLKDAKGLRYLAELLHNPGREFHVLELIGSGSDATSPVAVDLGDAGAVLDDQRRASTEIGAPHHAERIAKEIRS